jgi:CRISPR-associated exonuclease Cas4
MSAQERGALRPIRLVFELSREENPRLFDELSQFRQGRKRVNRLRLLAYDGLLAQHGVFAMASLKRPDTIKVPKEPDVQQAAAVTNGLFQPRSIRNEDREGAARDGAVGASELAQMGRCERLVVLESLHGPRRSTSQEEARRRGIAAHVHFELQGRRATAPVGGSTRRPGERCFIATMVFGDAWQTDCAARLQGYGPAAAALGAPPGGGLLCGRAPPLHSSAALPATARVDQVDPGFRGAWLAAMVGKASTMRFEPMWPWVLLLAVALAVTWHLFRRHRARVAERRDRPAALRDAELICVESQFRSKSRWPIVARVDRAYRLPTGLVVLVELKTRSAPAVRTSDVIQLSAQRVAVEDELRVRVSDEAFVIFPGRHSAPPTSRAVRLMSREQVEAVAARHRRLIDGLDRPQWPDSEHVCHGCGQRAACGAAGERLAGAVRRR